RDNILATDPEANDKALRTASRKAGLDEFVRLLPEGYDTNVGEAGSIMSGGVRQRIGLARAFLREPPVLLLDEPTSNLDRGTEDHLRQSLIEYAKTRTVIVVSHSPVLLSAAHNILFLPLSGPARFGPAAKVLQSLVPNGALPMTPPKKPISSGGDSHV
ncbi:MAG: ATP-binding cassette domain-containing protein, partial [Rhodospirillaceae bacterium]|nr:ATP-binding cassette domain-containing protein [Rhodospirillaceae bacterium]